VGSLLPERVTSLLDIGSGNLSPLYPFLHRADSIVCVDWNLRVEGEKPANIEVMEEDFLDLDFHGRRFQAIVCADVFEHILLEKENVFAWRCVELLEPGGVLVLSTPHLGAYAWLDPYQVKPAVHRFLARFGLYQGPHNGSCDIRKGHKHYSADELVTQFAPLEPIDFRRWGRFYDPLSSWADAIHRKLGVAPWRSWIYRRLEEEYGTEPQEEAFNIAIKFCKKLL